MRKGDLKDPWYNVACDVCHGTIGSLTSLMQLEAFDWLLDDVIIEICSFYENKTVCAGAIEEMTPIVMKTLFEGFVSSCRKLKPCCKTL